MKTDPVDIANEMVETIHVEDERDDVSIGSVLEPTTNNRQGESLGSEPWLRDDEVICPVTNLAYWKGLKRSPYVDENGKAVW